MQPYGRTVYLITTDSPNHRVPTVGARTIKLFSSDASSVFGFSFNERQSVQNTTATFWVTFGGKIPIEIDISGSETDLIIWTSSSSPTQLTYWVS